MRILITGANRGIGLALADSYRDAGHDVIATARNSEGLVRCDVSDVTSVRGMAAEIGDAPIDLLICNAGVLRDMDATIGNGFAAKDWADTFAVNVTGVFLTIEALLPNLRAAGGKIAIISSQLASQNLATGGRYIYRASKAAALNLGRNLSCDLKPDGIAVGIYHPCWVSTDMGGSDADIGVDQAVSGLVTRFAELSLDTTGCFRTYSGEDHPY